MIAGIMPPGSDDQEKAGLKSVQRSWFGQKGELEEKKRGNPGQDLVAKEIAGTYDGQGYLPVCPRCEAEKEDWPLLYAVHEWTRGLQDKAARVNLVESDECVRCAEPETAQHVFIECASSSTRRGGCNQGIVAEKTVDLREEEFCEEQGIECQVLTPEIVGGSGRRSMILKTKEDNIS